MPDKTLARVGNPMTAEEIMSLVLQTWIIAYLQGVYSSASALLITGLRWANAVRDDDTAKIIQEYADQFKLLARMFLGDHLERLEKGGAPMSKVHIAALKKLADME